MAPSSEHPGAEEGATDEALVAAFQAGHPPAFDELVRRHRQQIHRVCRGILRSPEQADEACQDAFVKAWHGLARFKGDASFKTWMIRIGMNAAHDTREREASVARLRDRAAREQPVIERRSPRPEDPVAREQELDMLHAALERLPDRQRTTLMMKLQGDLTYPELAEVLGCPVGTAKANVHHAVRNLRQALAESGLLPAAAREALAEEAP